MKNEQSIEKIEFEGKDFWTKLWRLLSPSHRAIRLLLVLIMLTEAANLVGPYILKFIIDTITNLRMEDLRRILELVFLMMVANQATSFLGNWRDRKVFRVLADIILYLSESAHRKMVYLDLGYHEKENTGNKITKIQRGVDKIDSLFGSLSWEVVPTVFQIVFSTGILFFVDWRFGAILLVFVPAFLILTLRVNRLAFPFRMARFDAEEQASGVMTQSIININTVKSFVQEERESRGYKRILKKLTDNLLAEYGKILSYNLRRNFVIDLGRVSMLLLGVFLALQNEITLGSLVFIITISEKSLISLYRVSRLYDRIMESSEAVTRLYDLSHEKEEIENPKNGLRPADIEGKISFKDVKFKYQESGIRALDNVSARINSGCVTALVGPSGGGKTTLARMIYRHYDPDSGEILLDGKNLKEYDLYAFRKFIAIVPQEVEIFNATIRENISYAKPGASLAEVKAAARVANAEEFVSQMQDGYDTLAGERGVKLSGGQRQRIGIARAVLANPRILIFDEATSNLDSQSEKLIQEAMEKISKGRTVIIIAHRLSTIKKSDKIIVLEKGKVVEKGSHFELAKSDGGLYRKLIDLQKMGDVG